MPWLFALKVSGILLFAFFAYLILGFVFHARITLFKLRFAKEYWLLDEKAEIEEISSLAPLSNSYFEGRVAVKQSEWMLSEDGRLKQGRPVFEGEAGQAVVHLPENGWVITGSEIRLSEDGKLSGTIHRFDPPFKHIVGAYYVNQNTVLIGADDGAKPYVVNKLWLVNSNTYEMEVLDDEPYYLFVKAPLIIDLQSKQSTALVYYSGDNSFGFGGDSDTPKYSTVRVFNSTYPKGKDLIRMSLNAGTIEMIEWRDGAWLITTDPSLPSSMGKPRKPARQWRMLWKDMN